MTSASSWLVERPNEKKNVAGESGREDEVLGERGAEIDREDEMQEEREVI